MQSASDVKQKVSEVFELLQDSVFRYLVRVLDDPSEAEDVMQETFIRLYRALHKGQVIEDVRPWIFRVAHNLVLYRFRKKSPVELLDPAGWDLLKEQARSFGQCRTKGIGKRTTGRFELPWRGFLRRRNIAWSFEPKGLSYREMRKYSR
jgi:hypothetical protein